MNLLHFLPEIITVVTVVLGGSGLKVLDNKQQQKERLELGRKPKDKEITAGGDTLVKEKEEVKEPVKPLYDSPERLDTRMKRLRAKLAQSNSAFSRGLLSILSSDEITEDTWDDLEDTLLVADVGIDATTELVDGLREQVRIEGIKDPEEVKKLFRSGLIKMLDSDLDRNLNLKTPEDKPAVVIVVGVNGVGKTTTVGKLARIYVAEDKKVLLGAADTFRAAAADQLTTWGERVGVLTVRSDKEGADPASVAFDAVKRGIDDNADIVLIDTAGRLQNKVGLMDELGKLKRVTEKQAEINETLLVLDATTGQNGLSQAKVFAEAVNITGIVLTKLDGSAKGGIVVAIQRELGVPVKLIGLGEGPDDLAAFEPEQFVDAILEQ
ncbi:MAG: signal recognition particle-docking protein FtsY [Micrococcaceae bacterium]